MPSQIIEKINTIQQETASSFYFMQCINFLFLFSICCYFYSAKSILGSSTYTPDSWAYYELSQTIFTENFYKFNTFRSYFSETYSTSFPLGYPTLLAILHFFAGNDPLLSVSANSIAAVMTWIVIIKLAKALHLTHLAGITLATSLVLFPHYLDEVFSGRAIPVALLFFLLAALAHLSFKNFLSGLFLGLSALTRFDYLAYSLILQFSIIFLNYKQGKKILLLIPGFLVGLSPWIAYSEYYFGKFWISDNSWIALSATPAFVLDFPAKSAISAIDNPTIWIKRILEGTPDLFHSIFFLSAPQFPIIFLLAIPFFHTLQKAEKVKISKIFFILSIIIASTTPYLLTGYFDARYFSLFLLCISTLMVYSIETSIRTEMEKKLYKITLIIAIILSIFFAFHYLSKKSWSSVTNTNKNKLTTQLIQQLKICHATAPERIYIFKDKYTNIAPQYGALTGNKAAFIPSNFSKMNIKEKEQYFSYIAPYAIIDKNLETGKCP